MAHQPGEGPLARGGSGDRDRKRKERRRHETARRVTFAQVDDRLGLWQMAGITIPTLALAENVADMLYQLRALRPEVGMLDTDAQGATTMVP
jgi:hypothetical protein